jgi:SAM-dependent methyltransferase
MEAAWRFDELAHAGREHLDAEYVARYDRKSGTDPSEDVAALRAYGVDASSTVVDLGAGTGTFVRAIAPYCGRVVAVDVSPVMISHLADSVARAGLTNIESVRAGFLTYEHTGSAVDAVYTRNALHHLPDFWKARALLRIARMLRHNGLLRLRDLVYDFEPAEADAVFAQWFDGAVEDPALGYTRHDLIEHVRTEHSTFRWLLEPMLHAAGFDIVEARFDRPTYGCYMCIKRR